MGVYLLMTLRDCASKRSKASLPPLRAAQGRAGEGWLLLLLLPLIYRVPFRSDGAGRQDPERGDAQGCASFFDDTWMYRRKILPAEWTWSAQRGRRVGRVCFLWATFLCTSKERCARAPKAGESSALALALALALAATAEARAFSPLRGASYFSLLVQRKDNQKKHTLPPRPRRCATRVHSAGRIFRRYILAPSKNDVRPARRAVRGLGCQLRRCGRGPVRQKLRARTKARATATATKAGAET